jgi:hypothetical protein
LNGGVGVSAAGGAGWKPSVTSRRRCCSALRRLTKYSAYARAPWVSEKLQVQGRGGSVPTRAGSRPRTPGVQRRSSVPHHTTTTRSDGRVYLDPRRTAHTPAQVQPRRPARPEQPPPPPPPLLLLLLLPRPGPGTQTRRHAPPSTAAAVPCRAPPAAPRRSPCRMIRFLLACVCTQASA